MADEAVAARDGTIIAIQGSVVDVRFEHGLPPINRMLRSGPQGEVVIEVAALTGPHTVRDSQAGEALNQYQDCTVTRTRALNIVLRDAQGAEHNV